MLLRKTIIAEIDAGNIVVDPFNIKNVGPNSVDVSLNHKLVVYCNTTLDVRVDNPTMEVIIPPTGLVLEPGTLYLGTTNETATSNKYVPCYDGRSSLGRLGLFSHITAGFGDVGFGFCKETGKCLKPRWTLELACIQPIRIYPNIRIGQVFFVEVSDEVTRDDWYDGKYSKQQSAQPSMMFKDIELQKGQ